MMLPYMNEWEIVKLLGVMTWRMLILGEKPADRVTRMLQGGAR